MDKRPFIMAYLAKRQFSRNDLKEGVRLKTAAGPVYATTEDLSAGGLKVLSDLNLQVGSLCEVEFDLRLEFGGRALPIKTVGKVVRSVQSDKGFHLGLQFVNLPDSVRSLIQSLSVDGNLGPF